MDKSITKATKDIIKSEFIAKSAVENEGQNCLHKYSSSPLTRDEVTYTQTTLV